MFQILVRPPEVLQAESVREVLLSSANFPNLFFLPEDISSQPSFPLQKYSSMSAVLRISQVTRLAHLPLPVSKRQGIGRVRFLCDGRSPPSTYSSPFFSGSDAHNTLSKDLVQRFTNIGPSVLSRFKIRPYPLCVAIRPLKIPQGLFNELDRHSLLLLTGEPSPRRFTFFFPLFWGAHSWQSFLWGNDLSFFSWHSFTSCFSVPPGGLTQSVYFPLSFRMPLSTHISLSRFFREWLLSSRCPRLFFRILAARAWRFPSPNLHPHVRRYLTLPEYPSSPDLHGREFSCLSLRRTTLLFIVFFHVSRVST